MQWEGERVVSVATGLQEGMQHKDGHGATWQETHGGARPWKRTWVPRPAEPATKVAEGPVCKLDGVDFAAVGCEQLVSFVDCHGKPHSTYVYLPAAGNAPEEGWPTVIYIHSLGYESPLIESSRPRTVGMQLLQESFVVISPIIGLKNCDAYFNTEQGGEVIAWVADLIRTLLHQALADDRGQKWVDPYRVAITGVSLGGGATYILGSIFESMLSCVAPVAAYHDAARRRELAEGLSRLPVYCVHSASPAERTCPIKDEEKLWEAVAVLKGKLHVERVWCKHGKTFSHAYEIGDHLWRWMLLQRRAA